MCKKIFVKKSLSVLALGLIAFLAVSCASTKKSSKADAYEQDYEDGLYEEASEKQEAGEDDEEVLWQRPLADHSWHSRCNLFFF